MSAQDGLVEWQAAERQRFEGVYRRLDLSKGKDVWNRPIYKSSIVQALWEGWENSAFARKARITSLESELAEAQFAAKHQRELKEVAQAENARLLADNATLRSTIAAIDKICHTPTPANMRANRHFQRDFDAIRKACDAALAGHEQAVTKPYVNPVDTHKWSGVEKLNPICTECLCQMMPPFRGISDAAVAPCPGDLSYATEQHIQELERGANDAKAKGDNLIAFLLQSAADRRRALPASPGKGGGA